MSDLTPKYRLRWRGRETGPHSWRDLEAMLEAQEIGLCHEVCVSGRWTSVEELMGARLERRPQAGPMSGKEAAAARAIGPERASMKTAVEDSTSARSSANEAREKAATERRAMPRVRARRRIVYVALGLVGGFLGLHNLYAGYWVRGAAQAGLSLFLMWIGFGWFLVWIWALAEVVAVHADGHGLAMQ